MRGVARGVMRGAQIPRHIFGVADVSYTAFAADFDGTNDYMLRGADLTGTANAKVGLFSCWLRIDGGDGGQRTLLRTALSRLNFRRDSANVFHFNAKLQDSNTVLLDIETSASHTTSASWKHLLASWDLGTAGRRHIFVNDVEDTVQTTFTDGVIDYTEGDWAIGAATNGSSRFNGCFSEYYFAQEWLDITVEANRRKFISAAGKPVSLGSDGSVPTGTIPIIYFNNPFGSFETNKGSGGNFTVTGALSECSSSPSN